MSTIQPSDPPLAVTAVKGVICPVVLGVMLIQVLTWIAKQPVTAPFRGIPFYHPMKYGSWALGHDIVYLATTQSCITALVVVAAAALVGAAVANAVSEDHSDVPHWTMNATRIFGTLATILSAFLLGVALASGAGTFAAVCLAVAVMAWCTAELDAARADEIAADARPDEKGTLT